MSGSRVVRLGELRIVWAGDVAWVTRNLSRVPRFYGITVGWLAIGVVIFEEAHHE